MFALIFLGIFHCLGSVVGNTSDNVSPFLAGDSYKEADPHDFPMMAWLWESVMYFLIKNSKM